MNISIKIHNSCLKAKTESEVLIDLAYHLWEKKLTSCLYKILVNLGSKSNGLTFASMDKSISDLFLSILGVKKNNISDGNLDLLVFPIRLHKWHRLDKEEFEDCLIEAFSNQGMCIIALNQGDLAKKINTYEQRIGLPFSCGRRNGIKIEAISAVSEEPQKIIHPGQLWRYDLRRAEQAIYLWHIEMDKHSMFNVNAEIDYVQGSQNICSLSQELVFQGFNQILYSKTNNFLDLFFQVWAKTKKITIEANCDSQIKDMQLYTIKEKWGADEP